MHLAHQGRSHKGALSREFSNNPLLTNTNYLDSKYVCGIPSSPIPQLGGSSQWILGIVHQGTSRSSVEAMPYLPLVLQRAREGGHFGEDWRSGEGVVKTCSVV